VQCPRTRRHTAAIANGRHGVPRGCRVRKRACPGKCRHSATNGNWPVFAKCPACEQWPQQTTATRNPEAPRVDSPRDVALVRRSVSPLRAVYGPLCTSANRARGTHDPRLELRLTAPGRLVSRGAAQRLDNENFQCSRPHVQNDLMIMTKSVGVPVGTEGPHMHFRSQSLSRPLLPPDSRRSASRSGLDICVLTHARKRFTVHQHPEHMYRSRLCSQERSPVCEGRHAAEVPRPRAVRQHALHTWICPAC
jgi:hypothetical protein